MNIAITVILATILIVGAIAVHRSIEPPPTYGRLIWMGRIP